jgi:hypothetical protein
VVGFALAMGRITTLLGGSERGLHQPTLPCLRINIYQIM